MPLELPPIKSPTEAHDRLKALETTKELFSDDMIPIERLEETIERILGINSNNNERKAIKLEESHESRDEDMS